MCEILYFVTHSALVGRGKSNVILRGKILLWWVWMRGLGGVGRGDDLGLGRLIGPTICALIRLVAMHAYMLE